jgi:hypothetical protein
MLRYSKRRIATIGSVMEALRLFLSPRAARRRSICAVAAAVGVIGACSPPPSWRSYDHFMDDSIARDGVLARCDQNPLEAQRDIECANARRAATAVLLREERARREALELESERKLAALRRQVEAEQRALLEGELAAAAEAQAAYEALWAAQHPEDFAARADAVSATPDEGSAAVGEANDRDVLAR